MKLDFARPDVADLVLHVYGRSVHPELFDVYAALEVGHDAYDAVLRMSQALFERLQPLGAKDLIDVQQFMWVTRELN